MVYSFAESMWQFSKYSWELTVFGQKTTVDSCIRHRRRIAFLFVCPIWRSGQYYCDWLLCNAGPAKVLKSFYYPFYVYTMAFSGGRIVRMPSTINQIKWTNFVYLLRLQLSQGAYYIIYRLYTNIHIVQEYEKNQNCEPRTLAQI